MDFASVTDIAIPEGDVMKIQDADMTVLWEKIKVYTFVVQAQNSWETTSKEFTITVGG